MRAFIAYALIVAGIPNFAGIILAAVIGVPLQWLIPQSKGPATERVRLKVVQSFQALSGFVAIAATAYVFRFLGVKFGIASSILNAVWITWYFFTYHQPRWELFCWLLGIVAGSLWLPAHI